jgi:15-cis-phytoene synthase
MALSIREIRNYPFSAWRQLSAGLAGSRSAAWLSYQAASALAADFFAKPTEAEQLMASHARTFRFATRFLPPEYRSETIELYSFFRTLDDLVDENGSDLESRRIVEKQLAYWEEWFLDRMRTPAPDLQVGQRIAGVVDRKRIPLNLMLDFLEGLRTDVELRSFTSRFDVERYSYQVASTVGISMAHVFRTVHPEAIEAARALGIAMQLTNILRDVGGDLARNRLYLPRELLDSHNLTRDEIETMWRRGSGPDPRLQRVMREMIEWADHYYTVGIIGIRFLPGDVRMPILIAARLYQQILRELEATHYDSLRNRAFTTGSQKIQELYRCAYMNRDPFWNSLQPYPATPDEVESGASWHAR